MAFVALTRSSDEASWPAAPLITRPHVLTKPSAKLWGAVSTFLTRGKEKLACAIVAPVMSVTPSELRANIYRLIDTVIETGVPLRILRGDTVLELSLLEPPSRLARLPIRNLFDCDPDELITRPQGEPDHP